MNDNSMNELVMHRFIDAPAPIVFGFLVDPSKLLDWLGISGDVDAIVGGTLRLNMTGSDEMVGEYVEIAPYSRVAFTWGWTSQTDVPPGSTTVTFDLEPDAAGTHLTLTHAGLPGGMSDSHAAGWTYFLSRLRTAATGHDPGPVALDELSKATPVLQEDR